MEKEIKNSTKDLLVWALQEDLSNEGGVINHEGQSQGLWVLLELLVNLEGHFKEGSVLRLLDVLHTAVGGGGGGGAGTKVK